MDWQMTGLEYPKTDFAIFTLVGVTVNSLTTKPYLIPRNDAVRIVAKINAYLNPDDELIWLKYQCILKRVWWVKQQ